MTSPATMRARRPSAFRLRPLVERIAAESVEADPLKVADRVLDQLAPNDKHVALRQAVAVMVRQIARGDGAQAPRVCVPTERPVAAKTWHRWTQRDACTVADLRRLAAETREHAARLLAQAAEFDALADELNAAGARTVGELHARARRTA